MKIISLTFFLLLYSTQIIAGTYTFGVVPQFEEESLKRMWDPFINFLNKHSANNFIFKTTRSIVEFELNLNKGMYDFVYLTPGQYIKYHRTQGYSAFAKVKDLKLRWIIVANIDDPANTINELSNRNVLFPETGTTSIINPLSILEKKNIKVTPVFVKTHEEVYNTVAHNLFGVGVGVDHTYKIMPNNIRASLKIIWSSDSFQPNAFAANARVPFEVVEGLRNTLVNIIDTDENRMILDTIKFCTGFESAKDSDWNSIREMEIKNDED